MFEIGKIGRLDLGYQGENKARVIAIDMNAWLDEFPGANVGMLLRRPNEAVFYPAALEMEDGIIEFEVTRSDVAIEGEGEAQIILTNEDDVELRSRVVKTKINASMSGTEVEAPPPENTFVTKVINAAAKAEAAVEKMPSIGENGNWHAWDATQGAYVDTGKPSRGEQGIPGERGEAGPVGPQGPTGSQGPQGPKGDTGATGPQGPAGANGKDGTGVNILGSYDTVEELEAAHPTGKAGDAYLIGSDLYVWSPTENAWINVGQLQGPKGDTGETGPQGPKGDTGATGSQGPKGDTGPQGPKGDTGPQGPKGDTGAGGKDAFTAAYALTVPSTAWTGSAAPYTATMACTGVTASNHIIVGAGGALTEEQQSAMAAAMIVCTGQGEGSITLTAYGTVPTIDLPVNVMIVG